MATKPRYRMTSVVNTVDEDAIRAYIKEHWPQGYIIEVCADAYMITFGIRL